MLRAAKIFKPDVVVVLGDFIDCAPISNFANDPVRTQRFKKELASGRKALRELETLRAKRYVFIEGNHEYRLPKYLMQKAPELFDFDELKMQNLLGLEKWEYVPYRKDIKIGKMYFTHDTESFGANAHLKLLGDYETNAGMGHSHHAAIQYRGNIRGQTHVGAMFGWLGDAARIDYKHKAKFKNWQLAFGTGYMEPGGNVHVQLVPIIDGRCVVEGQLVN
jgi:predicted phosphodiesterase